MYIVGAGPGNPQLLTLRAVTCLKRADVILYDRLIPKEVLRQFAPGARLVYVGKKASFHTLAQNEIEDRLVQEAKRGRVVVRLKGGDSFIFGWGGEECERLQREGIAFEVVPGVSSAFAVPLYAGIPLTHRKFTAVVAIVTGYENLTKRGIPYKSGEERAASSCVDWEALARMGTVVFLMGVGNLRANMKKLIEHGKPADTPVAVIHWGGLGKQKTVLGTMTTIADRVKKAGLKAPAIVVVGGVVSFSKKLNWFERLPLFGRRVLITRDAQANLVLADRLWERGADVIHWPSFSFKEVRTDSKTKTAVKQIRRFDWLVFTSRHGVVWFLKKYCKIHSDLRPLMGLKIAAVGKQTATTLRAHNLWVDVVSKKPSAKGLAGEAVFKRKKGLKILLAQGRDARDEFVRALSGRHKITRVVVYRKQRVKQPARDVEKLRQRGVDWILFFSPSAVDSFLANFKRGEGLKILRRTKVAVIGKTTAKHLRDLGCPPQVISRTVSTEALLRQVQSKS